MRKPMHCVYPNCFDDTCQGECQEESKASEECCNNDCGCEQETPYCED